MPDLHRVVLAAMTSLSVALSPVRASGQSSDEGAPFLLLPIGADAVALGRAVTAMPSEEAAFWNPAGLVSVARSRFVLLRGDVQVATSTAASVLFARPGLGTLGVSYLLMDAGDQELKDADDNPVGTISIRNHLAVVSTAAEVLRGLAVGINFKIVQARLSCRGLCFGLGSAATSFAIDAGMQLAPSRRLPLRLGAMVAHLGPRFQLKNASQADPLPMRVRVAVAYDVLRRLGRPDLEGWVTAEIQDRPGYEGGTSLFVGSELVAGGREALFVRAGYATDADQPGGASVGLGLRFEKFDVSVARSLATSGLGETEPFNVSLSVGF